MISDRISLNLAHLFLNRVHQSQGHVTDILLAKAVKSSNTVKTSPRFATLQSFKSFIQTETPITPFKEIDCFDLALYELKSFKHYDSVKDVYYTVENRGSGFITKGNLNKALLEDLSLNYSASFTEVKNRYKELKINEYILLQEDYIDCGYIEVYFQDDLENLKKLYKKYKETV
jgi:hypothetical protein